MRWYHWLGFFSPGVVSISFFAAGGRSAHGLEWAFEWGLPGVILGMVICLINSFWLPRRSGIGGFFFGLLVNAAFACGWRAIVFSH